MFKKLVIYIFVAIFLSSIFPNNSEAVNYRKSNFEITFPDQCDHLWDFSNGITADNNNYRIAVWFPTPLDNEQQKICNGKTELSQLTPNELQLLVDHLATIRQKDNANNKILRASLMNVSSVKAPAVHYIHEGIEFLDIQIIYEGALYTLTFTAKTDSFDKYEKEIFIPTISSFKIRK